MAEPRYPEISVQLTESDGNAFALLSKAASAMRRAGVPQDDLDSFNEEATSGDYDALLQTIARWVNVS